MGGARWKKRRVPAKWEVSTEDGHRYLTLNDPSKRRKKKVEQPKVMRFNEVPYVSLDRVRELVRRTLREGQMDGILILLDAMERGNDMPWEIKDGEVPR